MLLLLVQDFFNSLGFFGVCHIFFLHTLKSVSRTLLLLMLCYAVLVINFSIIFGISKDEDERITNNFPLLEIKILENRSLSSHCHIPTADSS